MGVDAEGSNASGMAAKSVLSTGLRSLMMSQAFSPAASVAASSCGGVAGSQLSSTYGVQDDDDDDDWNPVVAPGITLQPHVVRWQKDNSKNDGDDMQGVANSADASSK